ncbi:uncharacterized protein LMH87_008359 [Akanthomyces muscarius]|uniref:NmrA-like domain-containing protein n=1 Tax=Akanthomyces muscarius TaxID=2231603 RepID=A0A9W8QIJ4_AKAMU|nr:uncharacterized protein LMH87_008359 [Akanthomyces muscarius]KAJ4159459.1 hypothetical protein LMH87_008359 [Akanthomyces muscarius]
MPVLAIAGGTSASLGRAIVSAIISSQATAAWSTVILSRSSNRPLWLRAIDGGGVRTQIRTVDYLDIDSVAAALDNVHTLVSVVSAVDGTQARVQINLLDAAIQAGCRRFAPSYWGFGPLGWENISFLKETGDPVWKACSDSKDKIECAKFNVGTFMNYLGHGIYPNPAAASIDEASELKALQNGHGYSPGEDAACQGLQRQGDLKDGSGGLLIGIKNAIAELPVKEAGQWPRITLTSLRDVGKFFAASLSLSTWEEEMTMVGETLTVGELLTEAEAATGRKFSITTFTKDSLLERRKTLGPDDFDELLWTDLKLAYVRDLDDEAVLRPVVNRLCPEVQPESVRSFLQAHWKVVS